MTLPNRHTDVLHITCSPSIASIHCKCDVSVSELLQSVREEHFYTRFALMSFELPREKVGEAGWASKRFFLVLTKRGSSAP